MLPADFYQTGRQRNLPYPHCFLEDVHKLVVAWSSPHLWRRGPLSSRALQLQRRDREARSGCSSFSRQLGSKQTTPVHQSKKKKKKTTQKDCELPRLAVTSTTGSAACWLTESLSGFKRSIGEVCYSCLLCRGVLALAGRAHPLAFLWGKLFATGWRCEGHIISPPLLLLPWKLKCREAEMTNSPELSRFQRTECARMLGIFP